MSRALAIAGREVRAAFFSPLGFVVTALFVLLSSLVFCLVDFDQGKPATMRAVLGIGNWLLLIVCPAISMRSLAEERRQGTFELLMTSPLNDAQIIAGKFIGAMSFLAIMLAPTLLYALVLECYGRPDYGELACGYLGMLLAGSIYISSGILASSFTASQSLAFIVTFLFWLILNLAIKVLGLMLGLWAGMGYLSRGWMDRVIEIINAADPDPRLRDFAIGLIDTSNVVYFASITLVFLTLATKVLQAGRHR